MRNNIGMRAVLLAAAMLLGACSAAEFWNGEYAERAAFRSSRNKEAAFYAAESPQDAAYDRCMRRRGTPMWADDRG